MVQFRSQSVASQLSGDSVVGELARLSFRHCRDADSDALGYPIPLRNPALLRNDTVSRQSPTIWDHNDCCKLIWLHWGYWGT